MARVIGTPEDDRLFSVRGEDTEILGLSGNDTLVAGSGAEVLDGGAGVDRVSYDTAYGGDRVFQNGVTVNLLQGTATFVLEGEIQTDTLLNVENIRGSDFADTLIGDAGANEIQGFDGSDQIFGMAGDDRLFGGYGKDTVNGGDGNDRILATQGNEILIGGAGDDRITFGTTQGGEAIFTKGVIADLSLGVATATVDVTEYTYALEGFEELSGSDFTDVLTGNDGDNKLYGYAGIDVLFGRAGDDEIYGGAGDDTLYGDDGNDTLLAMSGDETFFGGNGEDFAAFSTTINGGVPVFTGGVTADLAKGGATGIVDGAAFQYTFNGIENLRGSRFADTLLGDAGNNRIEGNDGDDIIKGGAGDDFIRGGLGNDIALYDGSHLHFTIRYDFSDESLSIIDRTGAEGTDSFGTNILSFSDRDFTLLADGDTDFRQVDLAPYHFEALAELYIAYFNRAPDAEGLYFWTLAFINGTTLDQAADFFFDQTETQALYGADLETGAFVDSVYENVLGREPDKAGTVFWIDAIDSGKVTEGQFIRAFLAGVNTPTEEGTDEAQLEQLTLDRIYLNAKTAIGIEFAAEFGMSDVAHATDVMNLFDGSAQSILDARSLSADLHAAALETDGTGEFLIQLVGLIDDPFDNVL